MNILVNFKDFLKREASIHGVFTNFKMGDIVKTPNDEVGRIVGYDTKKEEYKIKTSTKTIKIDKNLIQKV